MQFISESQIFLEPVISLQGGLGTSPSFVKGNVIQGTPAAMRNDKSFAFNTSDSC